MLAMPVMSGEPEPVEAAGTGVAPREVLRVPGDAEKELVSEVEFDIPSASDSSASGEPWGL